MGAAGWGMKMCGCTDATTPQRVSLGALESTDAEQFAIVAVHHGDAVADQAHHE